MNAHLPPAGWFLDPAGLADGRYWDGTAWTAAVTRSGVTVTVPIDPTHAAVPPLPGTAIQPPIIVSTTSQKGSSPVAIGVGILVAALVVALFILIVSTTGSDDAPPPATDTPASAPPATEPVEGG